MAFVPDWRKSDYIDRRSALDYSAVNQNDLMPLPRMEDIKTDFNSNFTYLTMFRGKYMDEERVVGAGSHNGVDIRAPIGTPIFAIANGKVVKVKDDPDNKYITIEHRDVKYAGKVGKYYSSYLHLSGVLVQQGDIIDKGTLIGRVGMTGMTTTPHLHIQVDNDEAPFYPYWPFTWSEAQEAGLNMYDAVDAGLNQDIIAKYSVDPIDFIKKATTIDGPSVAANRIETPVIQKNPTVVVPQWTVKTEPVKEVKKEVIIPSKTTPIKTSTNTPAKPISGTFSDVPSTSPYYNSISYFAKRGIISGYADGSFKPEKNVTRAELLAIVFKWLNIEIRGNSTTSTFRDISNNSWINPIISEALKRKIISADKNTFSPDRPVTRVEFLAILWLASGEQISDQVTKSWKDVSWTHWSHKYAEFALKNALIDNISGDLFKPNQVVTRGELAQALYRYLSLKNKL